MAEKFNNILIIKPSALGDLVFVLPALSALRSSFPDAKISWLVRPEYAALIEGHRCLNEVVVFDRKFLGKWWCNYKSGAGLWRLLKKLRREKYDAVFDFQGLFRTAIFGWVTGAKKRYGFAGAREGASVFYTERSKQSDANIHLVDLYLDIVRQCGANVKSAEFELAVDEESMAFAGELMELNGLERGGFVCFVPGSAHDDKCWPAERFGALADMIFDKYEMRTVTIGTKAEKELCGKVADSAKSDVVNLAGQTNIGQLKALMGCAGLVVSNDTGPGHIGRALDVPTIIIIGRTNPRRICPYGKTDGFVAIGAEKRGSEINNYDPEFDIKNITVEMVFEKVISNLSPLG